MRGGRRKKQGSSKATVVLLCFLSEPEVSEEDERAKDGTPPGNLQPVAMIYASGIQHDSRNLVDTIIVGVDASPGDPWANMSLAVLDNSPSRQRDGETDIDGAHGHETPVGTANHSEIRADELLKFLSLPNEGA